ncbi:unnamed protein product [Adineta steineri]|uniref:RING-type domain-containing protein n=1 Tax=Adineta steineri TaxID=433720 RepID=A0A815KE05_9BILA|nr:unnamed protein product [Adineta steineri]CAF1169566.1 unnamed protein product [Adineta steineri]CAF1394218.1 unnamed protein product [Adineta steineri]CAF1394420.1 unnamed protein product [Adineta steineri]CAF1612069.1 unnamed protein product [Adineta steineri]
MYNSAMDEGNINRDRIVNGESVPEEYFCPICQDLLWKPRSCASCQHLFCEKCLHMWLENSTNANKCPFRCQPFEERRCPPYVHSLLAKLNIYCKNASFGCTATLSYDKLEQHEKSECQYLTQRCSECDQLVLVSKLNEHTQIQGLCIPQPIKCTICQNYFPKHFFQNHFYQCCEMKINNLIERTNAHQTLQLTADGQQIPINPGMAFFQSMFTMVQLFKEQRQFSQLPTSLKGLNAVRQAEEQNRSFVYRLLITLKFLLINWSKIPFFILIITLGNFLAAGILSLGCFVILSNWTFIHIHHGSPLLIILVYLLSYTTYVLLQIISDTNIIFYVGLCTFLFGCSRNLSIELLEMNILFNKPIICIIMCCLQLLLMKIILLLLRFYYWLIPIYIATTLVTIFTCVLAYIFYRIHATAAVPSPPATNRLIMPV